MPNVTARHGLGSGLVGSFFPIIRSKVGWSRRATISAPVFASWQVGRDNLRQADGGAMLYQELIALKRRRRGLSSEQITTLARG